MSDLVEQTWDGERCRLCGAAYATVYRVSDELWAQRGVDANTLCPACLDGLLRERGVELYWEATPNQFPLDLLAERDAGEERWREATDHWRNKADIAWRQRDDAEATLQEEMERANAAEARVEQLEGALRESQVRARTINAADDLYTASDQALAIIACADAALNHQGTETGGEGE